MQSWFKHTHQDKAPQGIPPIVRELIAQAAAARTSAEKQAVYWKAAALMGDKLGTIYSYSCYSNSHAHNLNMELRRAGFQGIECADGKCIRASNGSSCDCPDKFGYREAIARPVEFPYAYGLFIVRAAVSRDYIHVVDQAHDKCHITAALLLAEHSRARGHTVIAYNDGDIRINGGNSQQQSAEEFEAIIRKYCQSKNYDFI